MGLVSRAILMSRLRLCLVNIFVAVAFPAMSVATEFGLEKDVGGIRVSKAYIADSGVYRVRVETVANSSVDALLKMNTDPERWVEWMPKVISANFVEPGDKRYTVRVAYQSPWPVENRESITEGVITRDEATGVVRLKFHTIDTDIPLSDDFVRIEKIDGFWQFTPIADDQTSIIYEVMTDLGGSVPKFMVNLESINIPYETVVNMIGNIERYRDARIDWLH